MRFRCLMIMLLAGLVRTDIPAETLQTRVERMLFEGNYLSETVGIVIKDLETDSMLVSINQDSLFNPASVMKLVTSVAAFELLGLTYRFKTEIYISGQFKQSTGVVIGDLYIRGTGDPGLTAERMWLLVQRLAQSGIRRIKGDLVLDDTYFDEQIIGPGFDEDGLNRAYDAPTAALAANFNTIALHLAPGEEVGDPVFISALPPLKGVEIISTAKTSARQTKAGVEARTELMDKKTAVVVYGNMGLHEKPYTLYRKVGQPWESFGWICQAMFEECGIKFNGKVRHEGVPDSIAVCGPLETFESEPLAESIHTMLKYSSNFTAEMLFKTMAAENDTVPGSWKRGARTVARWWKENNFSAPNNHRNPIIKNGSGMGNGNRLTPLQIVNLLSYVWRAKKYTPEFINALPVAGVDGTLDTRFTYSWLKGYVRAKTGTLNNRGVSNLAGYVFLPYKTYAFAIMITNTDLSQYTHWTLQQNILDMAIPRSK